MRVCESNTDPALAAFDPEREDNILARNRTRSALWEEHLKDPVEALDKALKCIGNSCQKVLARVL